MFRATSAAPAAGFCTPVIPEILTSIASEGIMPEALLPCETVAIPVETSEMERAISLYLHTMPDTVYLQAPDNLLARVSDRMPLHEKGDALSLSDAGWDFVRTSWPVIRGALAVYEYDVRALACDMYLSALAYNPMTPGQRIALDVVQGHRESIIADLLTPAQRQEVQRVLGDVPSCEETNGNIKVTDMVARFVAENVRSRRIRVSGAQGNNHNIVVDYPDKQR